MGEKALAIIGTIGLILFNVLVAMMIINLFVLEKVSLFWSLPLSIAFIGFGIYFDVIIIKWYISKIKKYFNNRKKKEENV